MAVQKKINFKGIAEYCKKNHIKIKIIVLVVLCLGMIIRGIMQQPEIIRNKETIADINEEIEYEKDRQAEVEDTKTMVGTDEYIEKIARDKLGMIKSNEKIFIDISKSQKDEK